MNKFKMNQDTYNQLCCAGKINFENHNMYLITWLTYFKKFAIVEDIRKNTFEIYELVVE